MTKVIATFTIATIIASAFVDANAGKVVEETARDGVKTVTELAADGHNLVRYEVDKNGYKRNERSTCVYVPEKAPTLEVLSYDFKRQNAKMIDDTYNPVPESGDTVILDDVHRYVVLTPNDYAALTNRIFDLYAKFEMLHAHYKGMNANETGRTDIHGRRGHTTVTNGTIVTEYADGYKHVEEAKKNRIKSAHFSLPKTTPTKRTKSEMDARIEALRQKRRAAIAKTNEVSVVVGGGK